MNEYDKVIVSYIRDLMHDIENAFLNNIKPINLSWQFTIEGEPLFRAGKLACITGLEQTGKTFHLLRLMTEAIEFNYKPVLFFCKEGAGKYITALGLSYLSGISPFKIKTGMFSDDDWPKLTCAMQTLIEAPYHIEEISKHPKMHIETLSSQLTENEKTIGAIFIDDFENFKQAWQQENLGSNESDILLYLRKLAQRLSCPVLMTARTKQNNNDKFTFNILPNIEGDGDIASFCDDIFNLTRKEQNEIGNTKNTVWVSLQKSKHGRLGNINF